MVLRPWTRIFDRTDSSRVVKISEMFASPAWLLVRSHYSMDCETSTVKTASHLVPSILNGTFFSSGVAALRNCKASGGVL